MKKIISVLLSLISVICIAFAFSGCFLPTIELFTVGTYETYEVEGEHFVKAKLIIQPITKAEFESADGINVIKNNSKSKENNIYYSFELFIYDDIEQDYKQVKILNTKFWVGTPGQYTIYTEYESNGNIISEMTLNYHTIKYGTGRVPYPHIEYDEIYENGQSGYIILRFNLTNI